MQRLSTSLLITPLILLASVTYNQAPAQQSASESQERKLENRIPSHLPLKVVEVRNLQNEHWLRDLEVEVKNTSDRPIYYVGLRLLMPDVNQAEATGGSKYGVPLDYGSIVGDSVRTFRAAPEAPSLKPGESLVLRVGEPSWKGFEAYAARVGIPESETKRVWLQFRGLSFGDGTGFEGRGRLRVPHR